MADLKMPTSWLHFCDPTQDFRHVTIKQTFVDFVPNFPFCVSLALNCSFLSLSFGFLLCFQHSFSLFCLDQFKSLFVYISLEENKRGYSTCDYHNPSDSDHSHSRFIHWSHLAIYNTATQNHLHPLLVVLYVPLYRHIDRRKGHSRRWV